MKIKKYPLLVATLLVSTFVVIAQQAELEPNPAKLRQHVTHLASDAMDGRRTGTAGADAAARYIADEFSKLGLRPAVAKYMQPFPYVASVEIGKGNMLMARMHAYMSFSAGKDWMPLGFSANGTVENAPAILVGYGITASDLNHNDYSSSKVAGRVAIALSGTPDGDNPHSRFALHEDVRWKAVAARNAGAKALIVVARETNFADDKLSKLRYDNNSGDAGIPVITISRQAARDLLNKSIESIEEAAKTKSEAAYAELPWKISLDVDVIRREVPAYNVVGLLEGSDPVLKNEHIVIGAHYDHLGRGGEGSLTPNSGDIHHGADDNASGTAGLIELARVFSEQKPKLKRSIIFIAFGGEEEGLLGSNYYVNHPVAPL
ncbi:MAG TPA: M20/M25/M40 family metallo-hydrolase, partial [Pyrinomonadaceae bacterium]|nr:M20/M25/M40 family metallo-hydrolase [Pyrinomonadaceae bacterium]